MKGENTLMETKMKCNITVNLFTHKNDYRLTCPYFIFPESNIKAMKSKRLSIVKQVFVSIAENFLVKR